MERLLVAPILSDYRAGMGRHRWLWIAIGGLAAVAAQPAWSGPAPRPGSYSSVKTDGETGDEDGLRLDLRYSNGKPQVAFWWCEGECIQRQIHDLSIKGDQIAFVADDVTVIGDRQETRQRHFAGRFGRGGLSIGSRGFWKTERLKWYPD
jgi:hypothetical protein